MKKLLFLCLIPALVTANDVPKQPGSSASTKATSGSTSVAGASNAGNTQDITFNQGAPANQSIETVPSMSLYSPGPSAPCYIVVGGAGSGMGGGGSLNAPILSHPCFVATAAKDMASLALVGFNSSQNDPALRQRSKAMLNNAMDYYECAFEDSYLLRKVKVKNGEDKPCPVMPDRDITDYLAGGMPGFHIRDNPAYKTMPVVMQMQQEPKTSYTPPPPADPALSRGFEKIMRK